MMNKDRIKKIFFIFLISFIFQLIFMQLVKIIPTYDAELYDTVSVNLITGKGFSIDGVSLPPAYIKQGYVLFLAFLYKIFGHSIFAVKVVQAILVSFTCILTYMIGETLFSEYIGYCSALVTLSHPAFLIISSHILSEALFTFLFALSIFYLVKGIKQRSLKLYLLSGIFLGLSTQVRYTPIFFPFFVLAGLLLIYENKKYAFKAGIIIFLAVIIIAAPWAIRNYIHFGSVNPFLEQGGLLWIGSYTKGKAHQDNPEFKKALAEIDENLQKRYPQNEMSKSKVLMKRQEILLKLGFENIKNDPLGYIGLFPIKILRLWVGSYSGLFNIGVPFSDFLRNNFILKSHPFILFWKAFVFLFSITVFCLGIIGIISGFKMWRKIMPLYLVVIYFTLLHMILYSNTRMGIPVLPYMIIFAIAGSVSLKKIGKAKL